jgi:hypothetical protein
MYQEIPQMVIVSIFQSQAKDDLDYPPQNYFHSMTLMLEDAGRNRKIIFRIIFMYQIQTTPGCGSRGT